jgi:hypothetical protein
MIRSLRWAALALALGSALAAAQEPGGDVPIPDDLLAVLTLRGKPCGRVVDYQRQGDSDYLVTCSDGHRYRVFVGARDQVVIEDR